MKRKKPPSQREIFLQQLKADQEAREARSAARKAGSAAGAAGGVKGADGRVSMFDMAPVDAYAGVKGSFADLDDNLTTNLYIGNLAPEINEEYIARTFTVHGAIGSVKIMWPRTDEERARARNSGFVQFMDRKGAERAKNVLDGTSHAGRQIIVSWGKPVARPLVAMYPATVQTSAGFSSAGSGWSMTQQGAMVRGPSVLMPPGHAAPSGNQIPPGASNITILVKPPLDSAVMAAADAVAEFVKQDGWALEQLILEKEADNPLFRFLHDTTHPDHTYYRWRAYSLAQGDELQKFRTAPFQMYQGGPMWKPPACPIQKSEPTAEASKFSEGGSGAGGTEVASGAATATATTAAATNAAAHGADRAGDTIRQAAGAVRLGNGPSGVDTDTDSGRDRGRDREAEREARARAREYDSDGRARIVDSALSARQLDSLHEMLRTVTTQRQSIEAGLMFCLDHSEAADEVVGALYESLTLPPAESSMEKKLARLYLVSDILHNSSAPFPRTARFRTCLESKLATILGSAREALGQMEGKMASNAMATKIESVLDVWDRWSVYPPHSLLAIRAAFTGIDPAASLDGEALDMSMFDEEGGDEAAAGGGVGSSVVGGEDLDGCPLDGVGNYDDAEEAD